MNMQGPMNLTADNVRAEIWFDGPGVPALSPIIRQLRGHNHLPSAKTPAWKPHVQHVYICLTCSIGSEGNIA